MASNRRPGALPFLLALAILTGGGHPVAADGGGGKAFRCETEADLDGSACRVDMLPDAALAEMVYERWETLAEWGVFFVV